jgi:hypothetical protein
VSLDLNNTPLFPELQHRHQAPTRSQRCSRFPFHRSCSREWALDNCRHHFTSSSTEHRAGKFYLATLPEILHLCRGVFVDRPLRALRHAATALVSYPTFDQQAQMSLSIDVLLKERHQSTRSTVLFPLHSHPLHQRPKSSHFSTHPHSFSGRNHQHPPPLLQRPKPSAPTPLISTRDLMHLYKSRNRAGTRAGCRRPTITSGSGWAGRTSMDLRNSFSFAAV